VLATSSIQFSSLAITDGEQYTSGLAIGFAGLSQPQDEEMSTTLSMPYVTPTLRTSARLALWD
jgi:hypothetical protein